MYVPTRFERWAMVALAAVALTSCAPLTVRSYAGQGVSFSQYRTYTWDPADAGSTGDPRLDNNPFFRQRVEADVEHELAARGWEKTASRAPDLWLQYHARTDQRVAVPPVDREHGNCGDCRPDVYDVGTLTLDFTDARTHRLVWRGWAEGAIDGVIDRQELLEQRIDEAVARILNSFPRR